MDPTSTEELTTIGEKCSKRKTNRLVKLETNRLCGSKDSRLHVVEPSRGRSFIWQIGVNTYIQDRRQVDRGFYGVESVVRGNADSFLN